MNAGSTELTGQLRATLGKMEVALSAVGEAIVWTDAEGSIQWCNAAFDRLVDRPHIANLGAPLISLLPLERGGQPLAPEAHPATVALTDGVTGRCVYEVRRADNASVVEVSAVRIRPSEQEAN